MANGSEGVLRPSESEREGLAEVLADHSASYEPITDGHPYAGYADAVLASPWLRAHDDRIRAEHLKSLGFGIAGPAAREAREALGFGRALGPIVRPSEAGGGRERG